MSFKREAITNSALIVTLNTALAADATYKPDSIIGGGMHKLQELFQGPGDYYKPEDFLQSMAFAIPIWVFVGVAIALIRSRNTKNT